jgi:hypothetical protein
LKLKYPWYPKEFFQIRTRRFVGEGDPGYSNKHKGVIRIPVGEGNLDDPDILGDRPLQDRFCPIWRTALIHEMVHEWQNKRVSEASPKAKEFHLRWKKICDGAGPGHDEKFCQAIFDIAPRFARSREDFFKDILSTYSIVSALKNWPVTGI